MQSAPANGTLLVPVANPENVDRLLDTAIDLAQAESWAIRVLHVVEVPAQLPLDAGDEVVSDETEDLLRYVDHHVSKAGLDLETSLRYARDTAAGILSAVEEHGVTAILIGWRGRPRRRDIVLGSFLDHILRDAECDVYVKRISRPSESPAAILVPVAGGPHDELATDVAGALADQYDATVTLLHVVSEEAESISREAAEQLLEARKERLPSSLAVELTVMGATTESTMGRRLVGSVAQTVGRNTEGSVIVTRKYLDA